MSTEVTAALPTVPGYYVSASPLLIGGPGVFLLTDCGEWKFEGHRYSNDEVCEHLPLTRLVPETESARVEVDAVAGWLDQYKEGIIAYPITAALALADAINNGELDK